MAHQARPGRTLCGCRRIGCVVEGEGQEEVICSPGRCSAGSYGRGRGGSRGGVALDDDVPIRPIAASIAATGTSGASVLEDRLVRLTARLWLWLE